MQLSLLVMAAGMGTRYGGFKQLDHVGPNGETLLEYSIFDALRSGFNKVVFVIRKEIESAFNSCIAQRIKPYIDFELAYQDPCSCLPPSPISVQRIKPWGTGHAVLVAEPFLDQPFAVINGDDYYGPSAFHLISKFLTKSAQENQYCLVGYPLEQTLSPFGPVSRGLCKADAGMLLHSIQECPKIQKDTQGRVLSFLEDDRTMPLSSNEIASMNLWGLQSTFFEHLSNNFKAFYQNFYNDSNAEFQLPLTVSNLISSGLASAKVLVTQDKWFGITYREDLPYAQVHIKQLITDGLYPSKLWP